MPDESEATATAMWQDQHAGKRGHQLMTKKLADTIPAIYANESVADYDTVLAHAKLFSPYSQWTWFITEMDAVTGQCFGLVEGLERELGYFDLTELAETTVLGGVPAVERDLYWQAKTLGAIKNGSHGDLAHKAGIREGDYMNGDTGTEGHPSDVVNVEEFLFGGVTEETEDDAPADVGGGLPSGDATDEVGDAETVEGPDAGAETAVDEPDGADDDGEQPAPAEAETTDELKVVLSIRGGRAIIGVQKPSADPHIETLEDLDLPALAQEVPGVVERARDRWEEAPKYPAYEKPAPPPKRRNRRQQEAGQDADADGATEQATEQEEAQQTLRLF